jgi:hypothetical protein
VCVPMELRIHAFGFFQTAQTLYCEILNSGNNSVGAGGAGVRWREMTEIAENLGVLTPTPLNKSVLRTYSVLYTLY